MIEYIKYVFPEGETAQFQIFHNVESFNYSFDWNKSDWNEYLRIDTAECY
jgi:hypothetical protein